MGKGFLGLGAMSREDQIRVGLVAVLVLSLECVLEGLVTEATLRVWIFHAFAVGLSTWALLDLSLVSVRLASTAGFVAVGNEALIISEANESIRYLIPGLVLIGASGWVFQCSILYAMSDRNGKSLENHSINAASSLGFDVPPPLPPPKQLRKFAPYMIGSGSLLVLYGIFLAPWISTSAFFGLLRDQLTLSEVSSLWLDLDAGNGVSEFVASGIQIFSVIALLVSAAGAFGSFSRQFVIPRQLKVTGTSLIAVVSTLHIVVIWGLISADADVRVLAGAWLAPVGLTISGYGFWTSVN